MRIKIEERFFGAFVDGTKRYEIRKAEKGITSGEHKFESIENFPLSRDDLNKIKSQGKISLTGTKQKIYGTAHLEPIFIVSKKMGHDMSCDPQMDLKNNHGIYLDDETIMFIVKNYIGKHDFIIYEVSDVKEAIHINGSRASGENKGE